MPSPYTLDDFHQMSWQEFETAAVDAVRRLYSEYDIKVGETPYSKDGGRDGEAQHILAIGLGPELAISIKIFLEIKKRKNENVGKSDIGSHIVDAFANKATKVIFITNREFTEPLSNWLKEFCGPLNIQFSLVSGSRLLEWLNEPDNVSVEASTSIKAPALDDLRASGKASFNGEARAIQGQLTYTLDPNEAVGGTGPCTARSDRPVFAIVDINVGEGASPFHSVVDIVPKQARAATVHRLGGKNGPVIFSPGDSHRWVFAIWPERPGRWDDSCFEVILRDADVPMLVRSTNIFYVPEQGLGTVLAGPQNIVETAMRHSVNTWRMLGGISLRFLLSPGGLGKSFIVGRLRREWQAQGLREVVLDGETVGDDVKLIERTFSSLFPFPKSPFDDVAKPALARWLKGINLSPEACETLANDLCCPSGLRPSHYSASLRAQMFAALLAEASGGSGLVFVLEDLHKVSPSVLSVLEEGLSLLRAWGRGNVFALFTSRPAKEAGGHDITTDWLARLQELSALADDAVNVIPPPSAQDARDILLQTAPSLEEVHVRQIVEQVGTAPFNLREAVLYLRQLDVLQMLEPGGRPVLVDPARLNLLLEHDGLNLTTRRRLDVFFRDKPRWLRKLVEAGACYGRQFPFLLVAQAVHVPDWDEAMDAIGDCARWSLMALSTDQRENLEFDHDLVRGAVLGLMPDLRHRQLADELLSVLEGSGETVRMAGLAYQAGHAERSFDLARLAAREQSERGRPADALKANHIALLTLDPAWTTFDKQSSSWVDMAVQSAPVCRRKFSDWQQRDKAALAVLHDNLDCLGMVSAGSSALSDAILTEARMLSQRLGDYASSASLIVMEGRLLFERDDPQGALARHEEAERMFAVLGTEKAADRAQNLVRLAICQRQLGRREDSLRTLRQALKHRVKSDWVLLSKVRSNTGAAYLLSDWEKVRHHWERQLRSARLHGLIQREAHALASLSFINLFDGRQSEGRRQAEEALEITKAQGFDNTRVRCDLNLAVSSLMDGNPDAALHYLNEAESIAIQHQIGRRLWRVYANLATAHEMCGQMEKARARDLQTLTSLNAETWEGEGILWRGRSLLPLINIAFRAELFPELYAPVLLHGLRPETALAVREVAAKLAVGERPPLNGILLKYLVDISGKPRFLLTE
jgi:tetratricopeptide (TPR) repeat protein